MFFSWKALVGSYEVQSEACTALCYLRSAFDMKAKLLSDIDSVGWNPTGEAAHLTYSTNLSELQFHVHRNSILRSEYEKLYYAHLINVYRGFF